MHFDSGIRNDPQMARHVFGEHDLGASLQRSHSVYIRIVRACFFKFFFLSLSSFSLLSSPHHCLHLVYITLSLSLT